MPPKKPTSKKATTPKKQGKITGFFATPTSSSKAATPNKQGKITGFFATPTSSSKAVATKRKKANDDDVPPAKRAPDVTPEQLKQIDQNKSEAEVKLLKKKLGVDDLDASWVEALYSQFKKPYFTEVIKCTCAYSTYVCIVVIWITMVMLI